MNHRNPRDERRKEAPLSYRWSCRGRSCRDWASVMPAGSRCRRPHHSSFRRSWRDLRTWRWHEPVSAAHTNRSARCSDLLQPKSTTTSTQSVKSNQSKICYSYDKTAHNSNSNRHRLSNMQGCSPKKEMGGREKVGDGRTGDRTNGSGQNGTDKMAFCLYHFVQYHCVHIILSIPFCPYHFVRTIFVRYHFVLEPSDHVIVANIPQKLPSKILWL